MTTTHIHANSTDNPIPESTAPIFPAGHIPRWRVHFLHFLDLLKHGTPALPTTTSDLEAASAGAQIETHEDVISVVATDHSMMTIAKRRMKETDGLELQKERRVFAVLTPDNQSIIPTLRQTFKKPKGFYFMDAFITGTEDPRRNELSDAWLPRGYFASNFPDPQPSTIQHHRRAQHLLKYDHIIWDPSAVKYYAVLSREALYNAARAFVPALTKSKQGYHRVAVTLYRNNHITMACTPPFNLKAPKALMTLTNEDTYTRFSTEEANITVNVNMEQFLKVLKAWTHTPNVVLGLQSTKQAMQMFPCRTIYDEKIPSYRELFKDNRLNKFNHYSQLAIMMPLH